MKRFDFNNKLAIVTGASSGIGREISAILVKKYGCTVYGIARNLRKLDLVREELGEDKFICCAMDVSDRGSWEKFALAFKTRNTSPDILINCAGVLPEFASIENMSVEDIERVIRVNFMSCVYSCKSFMEYISDGGCIVNVSSASALCPFAGVGAYSASKAALERFTECLSQETRRVRICCVMPGFVRTNIMEGHGVNERERGIINLFSADAKKTASKIVKRVGKRKRRIVVGLDAHLMSGMFRIFPRLTPKLFTLMLKKSKMELFKNV